MIPLRIEKRKMFINAKIISNSGMFSRRFLLNFKQGRVTIIAKIKGKQWLVQ